MSDKIKEATEKVVKAYRQIYETTGDDPLDHIFSCKDYAQYKHDLIIALGNLSREFCKVNGSRETRADIGYMVKHFDANHVEDWNR